MAEVHGFGPGESPPLIEALAVWGFAVAQGAVPLRYAAAVLAEHAAYVHRGGTRVQRQQDATADLAEWVEVIVYMDWPGDDAIDTEPWHRPRGWWMHDRPDLQWRIDHCRSAQLMWLELSMLFDRQEGEDL